MTTGATGQSWSEPFPGRAGFSYDEDSGWAEDFCPCCESTDVEWQCHYKDNEWTELAGEYNNHCDGCGAWFNADGETQE
jgi:hypothetical protein